MAITRYLWSDDRLGLLQDVGKSALARLALPRQLRNPSLRERGTLALLHHADYLFDQCISAFVSIGWGNFIDSRLRPGCSYSTQFGLVLMLLVIAHFLKHRIQIIGCLRVILCWRDLLRSSRLGLQV